MHTSESAPGAGSLDIAIVGSGIAGLSAAWLLNTRHRVTVFEANDYAGGHSHTSEVRFGAEPVAVDTGFIVYNPVNYPNLVALFEHLDVPTKPSDMSFAASLADGALEYSGTDLNGLFAQRRNLVRPRFMAMLTDLLRFYREAPGLCEDPALADISLGEFLAARHYGDAFIQDHLLPMGGAIWSSSVAQMLDFPALAFLRFFRNHGLVGVLEAEQPVGVAHLVLVGDLGAGADAAAEHRLLEHPDARLGPPRALLERLDPALESAQADVCRHAVGGGFDRRGLLVTAAGLRPYGGSGDPDQSHAQQQISRHRVPHKKRATRGHCGSAHLLQQL